MRHITQPRNEIELNLAIESEALKKIIMRESKGQFGWLCGQCCLSMLLGTTLQEAIIACGQVGATQSQDLVAALQLFGADLPDVTKHVGKHPVGWIFSLWLLFDAQFRKLKIVRFNPGNIV